MTMVRSGLSLRAVMMAGVLWFLSPAAGVPTAEEARRQTGIDAGVAVVLADDAGLACDLADKGRMVVHLLCPDARRVDRLRQVVDRRGLGGRVVIAPRPAGCLPHPDRFVNLLIADLDASGQMALKPGEAQRVLAVRGVAQIKRRGKWEWRRRPKDERIDGWTHRFYDATGNAVSRDRLAGFPRTVQWQHGPAMEDGTADGRICHVAGGRAVFVDATSGDLVCRDAGNGSLLWRSPLGLTVYEGLAVHAGRAYLYHDADATPEAKKRHRLGYGPLVAVDLASGEVVQVYDQAIRAGTAEAIEYEAGGRKRKQSPAPWFIVREDVIVQAYGADLVVLDRATGRRRWAQRLAGATWFSPVAAGDLVLAAEAVTPARRGRHDGSDHVRAVVAWDVRTGKQQWRNERVHPLRRVVEKGRAFESRAEFKPISAADGLVLLHASSYQFRAGGSIAVLDAAAGRELWRVEFQPKQLYTQGSQRAVLRDGEAIVLDGTGAYRYDARTGKPLGEPLRKTGIRRNARANGACTASRATVDWLMCNGYLYVGPDGRPRTCFGARGACGQGVVPAHGLIYVPPTPCDCGDYVRGWQALASAVTGRAIPDARRLEQGAPAPPRPANPSGPAWPVFLGDPQRRGRVAMDPPEQLACRWSVQAVKVRADAVDADRRFSERYLGALSGPVVAEGVVVAAAPETHQVIALDAETGRERWVFATGGKVDSPPTVSGGLAVFGCDDGCVHAVRVVDGRLAWRFRAALTDGVAMHHGHLASAWPVPGSVLVLGGRVVAVAGHHTDIGGLHCWVLDLATGRPTARRTVGADQPEVVANAVPVADADGRGFWLGGRRLHLSLDLTDLPNGREDPPAPMELDRNGTRLRYRTNRGRGGSTHGWKQAMRVPGKARPLNGHRMVNAGAVAYGLVDICERDRRSGRVVWSVRRDGTGGEQGRVWSRSWEDMGKKESYSALVLAGERLLAAGGARDGSSGFVQVLEAGTGKRLYTIDLPARVTECGLVVAGGCVYVCCENGRLVCYGESR